jgi:photosystem II stability/assembly factor-like uncharacterized protein
VIAAARALLIVLGGLLAFQPASVVDTPRRDGWRIIGPGGGGATMLPTISPHDPRVVLVACDMTGLYLTEDGGDSWRMINLGTGVSSLAFDPADRNVIYAGNAALWRSADRGRTWRMVFPDPTRNTRALFLGDHADYALRSDDPLYAGAGEDTTVQAIAVAPDGAVTIALSGGRPRGERSGALLQSTGTGGHWRRLRDLPPGRVLALATATPDDIVVVLDTRVLRHVAGAEATTWLEHDGPPGARLHDASVALPATAGGARATIYALNTSIWRGTQVANGVFVSRDDGATWTPSAAGLDAALTDAGSGDPPAFRAVTVSPSDPSVAYVGIEGLQLGAGADHRFNGIVKTTDGGRTWRLVHRESNRPSPRMVGSWLDERAINPSQDVWFDATYDIGVSPTRPDIVFVTDLFRTYRTLDGGGTFAQVHSREIGPRQWATRGLDVTTAYGVHADPFDARRLFISYTDIGLFRSDDSGRSWTISSDGIPQRWRNTVYWLVFDPAERGLAWAALSGRWRPVVDAGQRPARRRGDPPAARSAQLCRIAHALRHHVRPRRLQDHRRRRDVDAEERRSAGHAVCLAPHTGARRASVSRRRAAQRARTPGRRGRRRGLRLRRRRRALDAPRVAGGNERAERDHGRRHRRATALSRRLGRRASGRRHRRRHLRVHRRRRHLALDLRRRPTRLRRHPGSAHRHALRIRLRSGRLALRRSRRALAAARRVRLQVGAPRRPGSHVA